MHGDSGFEVPPLSRREIRLTAERIRRIFGISAPYFPILEVLDVVIPRIDPEFTLEVCSGQEMGANHGLTDPVNKLIRIREDVMIGAREGNGRDRGTLAHEFGHLILHRRVGLARRPTRAQLPAYQNSEWQAKAFAGELLVYYRNLHGCRSPADLAERFGVSHDSAETQWRTFLKEGLIKE